MAPGRNSGFDLEVSKLQEFEDELTALKISDRKKYAQTRRENPKKLRALAAIKSAEKRIRVWKKKIVALEGKDNITPEQKKEMRQQYETKIAEIEQSFIEKYGGFK